MVAKSRNMKFTDLKDMLKQSGEVYGDKAAFKFKTENKGEFKIITHKEFRNEINALGTALIKMGLKDKRIAVISENRYEWEVAYLSIVAGTGVVVPLDKALPENEIESLKQNGIDPKKDLIIDTSIAFNAMSGAFIGGTGDFVTLFEPNVKIRKLLLN